jgi:predicted PurR-regulated permease PerM
MKASVTAVLALLFLMTGAPVVSAASQASFNGASSAVQSAFVAVQTAGRDGGNTTSLVSQLNGALALVQKAFTENRSSPAQAAIDLQSAASIAQGVQSSAATVAQQGTSARQFQLGLSIGSAIVIIGIAVALYAYGDRIYRRTWLRVYRGHVVKKNG